MSIQLTDDEKKMEDADRGSIEFTAPGFSTKLRGAWTSREVVVVIVVIACTAFIYLDNLKANRGLSEQNLVTQAQNVVTQSLLASVLKGQVELTKEISTGAEIQAYVISLPQNKREQLNLSMPSALRNRIRSNSQ